MLYYPEQIQKKNQKKIQCADNNKIYRGVNYRKTLAVGGMLIFFRGGSCEALSNVPFFMRNYRFIHHFLFIFFGFYLVSMNHRINHLDSFIVLADKLCYSKKVFHNYSFPSSSDQ